MKISVVICTKNNPAKITRCIDTILKQTTMPFELLIVDASTGDETKSILTRYSQTTPFVCTYIKQDYGYLTHARNMAIRRVKGDIVTFLDDDVLLHSEYLENILDVFHKDYKGMIGGAQGYIADIETTMPLFLKLFRYLFLLDSPRRGIVIYESGYTTYLDQDETRIIQTEWLSGCNMSFRRRVVREFRFNEGISCTYDPDGYRFVGEDVEYCHRVSKKHILVAVPNAKLVHPMKGRITGKSVLCCHLSALYHSKRYWLDNYIEWTPFRELLFWWSFVGQFFMSALSTLVIYSGRDG